MSPDFLIFTFVGFLAQLVDGALGMAYGVISSSVLLSFGISPAFASASAHAAEVFTTATSASAHGFHRNIDWKLFWKLAPTGVLGGVLGAYVLTSFDGAVLRPFVTAYLGVMGIYILVRAFRAPRVLTEYKTRLVAPLGAIGGFVDAAGGGGWGPVVTTSLIGAGGAPRYVIGTVNTAEFFLTVAVSATFVVALLTGHWAEADGLLDHALAVAGLILGGVIAAPLTGWVVRHVPAKPLMKAVGILILCLAVYQAWRLF